MTLFRAPKSLSSTWKTTNLASIFIHEHVILDPPLIMWHHSKHLDPFQVLREAIFSDLDPLTPIHDLRMLMIAGKSFWSLKSTNSLDHRLVQHRYCCVHRVTRITSNHRKSIMVSQNSNSSRLRWSPSKLSSYPYSEYNLLNLQLILCRFPPKFSFFR